MEPGAADGLTITGKTLNTAACGIVTPPTPPTIANNSFANLTYPTFVISTATTRRTSTSQFQTENLLTRTLAPRLLVMPSRLTGVASHIRCPIARRQPRRD